jgi:hypothetical protein
MNIGSIMYLAEIKGKLSSDIKDREDVLTSNVFSFFKYSSREIFLRSYLADLGFNISDHEAREAEFLFWPRYQDNTEPDVVIIAGKYYLLFEAKLFSSFGVESKDIKAQLIREIEGGRIDAASYGKSFKLIAITADHYYKETNFDHVPFEYKIHVEWTNWQRVSAFLYRILNEREHSLRSEERDFAMDLYYLLDKKNLRDFQSFSNILPKIIITRLSSLFFQAKSAKYRGKFIGFLESLAQDKIIKKTGDYVFFNRQKLFFNELINRNQIKINKFIFYQGR